MIVEVESNENCEQGVFARFKETGAPRPAAKVRIYDRRPEGEWCWVTGWSDDPRRPCCPAYAQRVEDSGAGSAVIVYGGIYGLRLRPVGSEQPWSLTADDQWGEPYLSLADERDVEYAPG